jgi:isoquinoline 1-oxidoreductase beta subunit
MKRRAFLVMCALAGGGMLAGCVDASRQQRSGAHPPLPKGQLALNGWVRVGADGAVTVVVAKSEMGQGIHTGLAMLVAEELDCAWNSIRLENAPIDPLYGNVLAITEGLPFRPDDEGMLAEGVRWVATFAARQLGIGMTGGSSSLRDLWWPMRHAAAATRGVLVDAAARHWGCTTAEVSVADGTLSAPGGRRLGFGEAVQLAGPDARAPKTVTLKEPGSFRVLGQPRPRIGAAAQADGSLTFTGDLRLPGMLHAAVRMAPVRGGSVRAFDDRRVRSLPGVAGVVRFDPAHGGTGGVAVLADRRWRAVRALGALQVAFDDGPMANFTTVGLEQRLFAALEKDDGFAFWKEGDASSTLTAAPRRLEARYSAPYLAHAPMEPTCCTVAYQGDRATVWAPTQVPGFARRAAARALGLDEERVALNVMPLGGGFGRRLDVDFVAQAAQIARGFPGRPVQVVWSREDDTRHDFYRPACVASLSAGLDARGRISAWRQVSAGQAITPAYMPRTLGLPVFGPDKTAAEGAFDRAYQFPAVHVGHLAVELPVPVGYWRSVGHSHHAFFSESFLDECAHAAGADPLDYRMALLADRPRHRAVLALAARQARWSEAPVPGPDGALRAKGLALHESFGAIVAQVVEVSVHAGAIRVHRVTCAIDCGFAINPNLVTQQMEGAVVFGLTAALGGRIEIEAGSVVQGNFNDQPLLRMSQCPVIETHLMPSALPPGGVGEPGVPPVAPALANALFALTGKRLRSLPLVL